MISFIIDGLLLFALFAMTKKVKAAEELELRQKQVASEIEDLFSSYLYEIKEENKRMEAWMSRSDIDVKGNEHIGSHWKNDERQEGHQEREHTYEPPIPAEGPETYQPSTHSKIIDMKAQGYSFNEIAKHLGKGKTETELLYKFQQKIQEKT
ncbi:DUF6115 domain-containing protein [Halobacillus litoralis]|uniref:DUF6115 domain-containing protein n=1 Tax=Halobacillus litoralis TaxID=45668 RepID=UPI001CFF1C5A|nr:hypothetical protein [Halobacillus litoralis]